MSSRSAFPILLVTSLVALSLACNGTTKPQPRRPGTGPEPRTTDRARTPSKPTPRGPDVSKAVTLSIEVDGLARLDKQLIKLLPPMFAQFARGSILRRMLPDFARKLKLNSLALDALDDQRPAAFALIVKRNAKRGMRVRVLAALPIKGDGKLVADGLKASYDSVTETSWGGLQVKNDGETLAWVRVHKGWVVVAPTAPLLDSARRYLVPRATRLPAGHVRAHLNARQLVAELTPLVTKAWAEISPHLGRALGSLFGSWMGHHVKDLEKIGAHLASLDTLSLELKVGTSSWRWRLDAKPRKGGALSKWIAKQKAGAGFGLKVLPPKPFVAVSDWVAPELRSLVARLVSSFTSTQLDRLTNRLPREVAQRGLFKRKRPAPLYLYRKTLRDLNLKDYRASHKVYQMVWHVYAFRKHLKKTLPPLLKTATGKMAGALYATPAGPGLGFASVTAVSNRKRHQRLYKNALWGTLQNLNRLARAAWALADKKVQKLFGKRPFFQFVFRQTAVRVGRVPVSAVALRIKWPGKPRGTLTRRQKLDHEALGRWRKIIETVLGTGDLTWAWAYAGNRVLTSAGRDWKPRIISMVKAATGKGGPTLATDPQFQGALKKPAQGKRLGLLMFSSTRLVSALLKGLFKFYPRAKRSMQVRIISSMIQRDAKQAKAGTLAEVLRLRGGYRIQSVLPAADVRSLLMSVGYLFYGVSRSSSSSKGYKSAPARVAPPHHP